VEAAGQPLPLTSIFGHKACHRGLCGFLQESQGGRTGAPQPGEDLRGRAPVASGEIVAHRKQVARIGKLPVLKQRLVACDHRIQCGTFGQTLDEVVQIMSYLAVGLLANLEQSPAKILAHPGSRGAPKGRRLPLAGQRPQHRLHPLFQGGKAGVPPLLFTEEQLDPSVEGRGLQPWAMRRCPGQAVRRQIQVHVAVGDRPPLPKTAANGAQLQLDVAPALLLPVLHQGRIGIGALRTQLLAGRAGALKKSPLLQVIGAAAQAHLVEKIPECHRQQLGEACRGGQIETTRTGFPAKTHQAVAELMRRPLRPVGGVEARHHPVQAEIPEFHLGQLSVAPGRGPLQVRAPVRFPVGGQFQAMEVLKVGKKQPRTLGQSADGRSGKRTTELGDWGFHAAFL
jgi:hypothetical protein